MTTSAEKGHFPQKKGPGTILKMSATIAGIGATVAGIGAGMDALNVGPFADSSNQEAHDTLPGGMPSATATATQITESLTPEPTSELTLAPTETPPPTETPVINCEILPQEFCGNAEVIEYKTLDGNTLRMLGFKSLPAGTKIVTPLRGTLESVIFQGEGGWKGWGAIITDPSSLRNIRLIGDLSFAEPVTELINEGDPVTTIKGSVVENFGYNLLVNFTTQKNGVDTDDVASYEALFPGIVSQKPVMLIEQTLEGIAVGSYYFPGYESPPSGSQQ